MSGWSKIPMNEAKGYKECRWSALFLLLTLGASACETRSGVQAAGRAVVAILTAPPDVQCLVIQAVGSTTVSRSFNLAPEANTTFVLDGLPLGSDAFSAKAFPVSCDQLVGGASVSPNWFSDPVTALVVTSPPVAVTLIMTESPVDGGSAGRGVVGVEFPTASFDGATLPNALTEFSVNVTPRGIVAGPDGNIWFTSDLNLGTITPAGAVDSYVYGPSDLMGPVGPATGSDGNVWIAESAYNTIRRITTAGFGTSYTIPTPNCIPQALAVGSDGNLWFTERLPKITSGAGTGLTRNGRLGRVGPSGAITEVVLPSSGTEPYGIAAGADGSLWFTEWASNKIGRCTLTGTITEFDIPTANSAPQSITAGPDGNLWFVENSGNKIGRVRLAGTVAVTEFSIPTAGSSPLGITAGPDGNVWFTENAGNNIGRITTSGAITEFALPNANSQPAGITAGPDGDVWFTEPGGNRIGRIVP